MKKRSCTRKENSNNKESAGGMEQGHEDMCSSDDKEIRNKKMSIMNMAFVLFIWPSLPNALEKREKKRQ